MHAKSLEFVQTLESFLQDAIRQDIEFEVVELDDGLRVGPRPLTDGQFRSIRLSGSSPGPLLRVEYKLEDDESGRYFRVHSALFGLYVERENGKKKTTEEPLIRVEFERSQTPSAHVHFHTWSQMLGWIYGIAGGAYRKTEGLHFPVGSRRFRPTVEEFLLFLDRERLFRGWRTGSGWRKTAEARLLDYERHQALGTVRHFSADIAQELRELGWTVTPPAEPQ